jgi:hypothetical protein
MRMFLSFIRKRLINSRAEALLLIKAFKVKGCCAGSKSSADIIIDLLFIDLRYRGFVFNSIRLIHFIGSFSCHGQRCPRCKCPITHPLGEGKHSRFILSNTLIRIMYQTRSLL